MFDFDQLVNSTPQGQAGNLAERIVHACLHQANVPEAIAIINCIPTFEGEPEIGGTCHLTPIAEVWITVDVTLYNGWQRAMVLIQMPLAQPDVIKQYECEIHTNDTIDVDQIS